MKPITAINRLRALASTAPTKEDRNALRMGARGIWYHHDLERVHKPDEIEMCRPIVEEWEEEE